MKQFFILTMMIFLFARCGGSRSTATGQQGSNGAGAPKPRLTLSSPVFDSGQMLSRKYTGDGDDVSPALKWDNVPAGTKSFALICSDPDAPLGTFVHWVIYDLPADVRELAEGVPKTGVLENGAHQGVNGFRNIGYNGPKPPPGKPHRYFFRLYALDTVLGLEPGVSAGKLQGAMAGHILAEAELMVMYGR